MFPIHNESGKIIGFGGRALDPNEQAKYLNSPETPIYRKSYVLYNLHRAKHGIRQVGPRGAGGRLHGRDRRLCRRRARSGGELRHRADLAAGADHEAALGQDRGELRSRRRRRERRRALHQDAAG